MLSQEQVEDLVKRYALACNTMLELERSNIMDLYLQICACYFAGQAEVVIKATMELVSSGELPEPVRSNWASVLQEAGA